MPRMNIEIRKTITYRILAIIFISLSIGLGAFSMYKTIALKPDDMTLILIAIIVTIGFAILQIILFIKSWKKAPMLEKIVFNENQRINTIPIFAVSFGLITAIALISLGISVYFIRPDLTIKCSMLVVSTIGGYLLANCLIYFVYLIIFRKREFNITCSGNKRTFNFYSIAQNWRSSRKFI